MRESLTEDKPSAVSWAEGTWLVGMVGLAFALRLYVASHWAAEPVWDGHYYDFGARRIAEGFGYSDDLQVGGRSVWHPWCHYPVGYSAFLALGYKVLGATSKVAGLLNAAVGALLSLVTWRVARHFLSSWRSHLAAWVVALHPGLVLYSALVMSEQLATLLTLAAFDFALVRGPGPSLGRRLITSGLILGLAALVRPQALLCAPFVGVAIAASGSVGKVPWIRSLWAAAMASMLALVPVLPWTLRNCRVMDGCALVSTNAGWNLAIGAFPRATGRFETLRSSDGCREVTGQVQQDRCWFAYGVNEIRKDPRRYLLLMPKKLGFTFDHESFPVEYLHEARPEVWPDERRGEARHLLSTFHRILLCMAVFVAIGRPSRWELRGGTALVSVISQGLLCLGLAWAVWNAFHASEPRFWPFALGASVLAFAPVPGRSPLSPALLLLGALLVTTLVTHAVFFGEDRYHVVVVPVLAIFALAGFRKAKEPVGGH